MINRSEKSTIARTITEETFLSHVANHSIREVVVQFDRLDPVNNHEGWTISVRLGDSRNRLLAIRSRRETVRLWKSLKAVVNYCRAHGITVLTVEL